MFNIKFNASATLAMALRFCVALVLCWAIETAPCAILINSYRLAAGGGGGGSPAWVDYTASANINTSATFDAAFVAWTGLITSAGTLTKLRIYITDHSETQDVKMGIYDSGGNRLQVGSASMTTTGYVEVTITSQVVTSFYIVHLSTPDTAGTKWGYQNGVGEYHYGNSFSSDLPATLPTELGSGAISAAVSAYITP